MRKADNVPPSLTSWNPLGPSGPVTGTALFYFTVVCETIPTERPPPVGEVSANFCG